MKKITLSVGMFFLIFSTHAQVVLHDQASIGTDGFGSGYSNFSSIGIYSGDDFELTVQSDVYSITVHGYQPANNVETLITGFSLYVYNDASGVPGGNPSVPGTGVLEIIDLAPTDAAFTLSHPSSTLYDFTVDIALAKGAPLSLSPGTYWIVAVPHGDAAITETNKFWYYFYSGQAHYSDAQFIDPSNFYGAGFTSWTPITTFGDPNGNALSFTVMGQNLAIADTRQLDQISLYPNPTNDKLYINMPESMILKSAMMVDLLGRKTPLKIAGNNFLDLSKMASGIYILQLETRQGTFRKKVIKK